MVSEPHHADHTAAQAGAMAARHILICDDLLPKAAALPAYLSQATGLQVNSAPASKMLVRRDAKCFGVFALHRLSGHGEAELIVVAVKGLLQRPVLRYLAAWIFEDCGIRRLVCRIPSTNASLQHYARRSGFSFEGRAARYFSDDVDASVWVMFAHSCPWLTGGHNG